MTPMNLSTNHPIVYARVADTWSHQYNYDITEDKENVSIDFIMTYLGELKRYEKVERRRLRNAKKNQSKL
jgi:hypothetical protein